MRIAHSQKVLRSLTRIAAAKSVDRSAPAAGCISPAAMRVVPGLEIA